MQSSVRKAPNRDRFGTLPPARARVFARAFRKMYCHYSKSAYVAVNCTRSSRNTRTKAFSSGKLRKHRNQQRSGRKMPKKQTLLFFLAAPPSPSHRITSHRLSFTVNIVEFFNESIQTFASGGKTFDVTCVSFISESFNSSMVGCCCTLHCFPSRSHTASGFLVNQG